jgi:hypothetical protein
VGIVPLNQPHFDDERTVQSARRVVPLTSVKRRARLRSALYMSAFLIFSGLLGSGVALLSVRFQNRGGEGASDQGSTAATAAAIATNAAAQGTSQTETALASNDIVEDNTESSLPSVSAEALQPKHSSAIAFHRPRRNVTQDDSSEANAVAIDSSGPTLTANDHWEERRVRRVLRRVERRRALRSNSDLFRIPEIFEGTKP